MSRRMMSVFFTVAALSFLAATVQPTLAIQCGDQITVDTKLYADLGPCPGDGLLITEVPGQNNNVTLDLNGHTVTGTGAGNGVVIGYGGFNGNAIIKGAGTIKNFAIGISFGGGMFGSSLIYNLVLTNNQTGIWLGLHQQFGQGQHRVLNNIIIGTNRQTIGVDITHGTDIYVYQNTIRGHSVGVRTGQEVFAAIDQNLITLNQTGIAEGWTQFNCVVIRGNQVALNQGDAIVDGYLSNFAAALSAPEVINNACQEDGSTIEDNTVSLNGGTGIVVNVGAHYGQRVKNNMVFWNKTNGISIIGGNGQPVQVTGNDLSRNGTDLLWDGTSSAVCGLQNIFETSSGPALPDCQ